jgi:hypothetical protein
MDMEYSVITHLTKICFCSVEGIPVAANCLGGSGYEPCILMLQGS